MIVIEYNITARSIESQSGIRFEGCSATVSTLHQGVYAEGPLHRGRPANVERIAFRWPLYADELRACVNHFTNLDGLSSGAAEDRGQSPTAVLGQPPSRHRIWRPPRRSQLSSGGCADA
jgi:hypothetical protein